MLTLWQVLAGLLYEAAQEASLVDPDKVQRILGVAPGEATRPAGATGRAAGPGTEMSTGSLVGCVTIFGQGTLVKSTV